MELIELTLYKNINIYGNFYISGEIQSINRKIKNDWRNGY